jgi:hypothetical protein
MYWIVGFIFLCALGAVWSMLSDHESAHERRLRRIRKRLAQKEREQGADEVRPNAVPLEDETRPSGSRASSRRDPPPR